MRKESTQEFEYQEARIIGIILAIVKDSYQTGFPEYFLSWILPLLSLSFLVQKLDFFLKMLFLIHEYYPVNPIVTKLWNLLS